MQKPDLRLQRAAVRLQSLPPRVICELLAEIGEQNGILPDVLDRAEKFATLDVDVLRAAGADRFPHTIWRVA